MSRRVLAVQLASFGAIAALVLVYGLFSVVGLPWGGKSIHLSIRLADAAGLFPHANVDYRGHQVGTVSAVGLSGTGVVVEVQLEAGTVIPTDSTVYVQQLSAVGEQYIDFRPQHSGPPYLEDGDVIPESRTVLPLPIATALVDLESLVQSVNPDDLHVVVDELATAFGGTGPELHQLISSAGQLVDDLRAAQPQTVDLLDRFQTVLPTLVRGGGDIRAFSTDLAKFTTQLAQSDGDLRALISNGTAAVPVLDQLVRDNGPALTTLLGNLVTTGNILVARVPGLRELLVALPEFGSRLAETVRDGRIQGQIYVDSRNDVCYYGTPVHSPLDPSPHPSMLNAACPRSAPDMLVRGAQNAPRPPGDSASTSPQSTDTPVDATGAPTLATWLLTTYDPATGHLVSPLGGLVTVSADAGPTVPGDAALSLLLAVVSR